MTMYLEPPVTSTFLPLRLYGIVSKAGYFEMDQAEWKNYARLVDVRKNHQIS